MKITVNKDFTHVSKVATVKNTLAAFKRIYTENDVLAMFNDATENAVRGDVLKCDVSGWDNVDGVGVCVEMIIHDLRYEFVTVRFYLDIDDDGVLEKVATDPLLVTVDRYRLVI